MNTLARAVMRGDQRKFKYLSYKIAFTADRDKEQTVCFFQPFELNHFKLLLNASIKYFTKLYNTPPKTFLDVGCGVGDKLLIAHNKGLDSDGIELSPTLANAARQVSPLSFVFETDLFKFKHYNNYDIIFVFNPTCYGGEKVIKAITKRITSPCLILYTCTTLPKDTDFWSQWRQTGWLTMGCGFYSNNCYSNAIYPTFI